MRYAWEDQMDAELKALEPAPRMVAYSELIMHLTREVLARLAEERRELLLEMLADPDVDETMVAEMIGTRRTTIRRLKTEAGRRRRVRTSGVDGDGSPQ